jgi:diadenosine tetraphosphate (Ap4A) HIT family hydrolase
MSERRRVPFDVAAYIEHSTHGPCFLCRLLTSPLPANEHVIYRDDRHVVFLPNFHIQLGYVLVAPVEHREAVAGDFSIDEYLALQILVHRVARALPTVVPTERVYVLSLGSQQATAHVHWHVVALPPGVPYEEQQYNALIHSRHGVLDVTEDERRALAAHIRAAMHEQSL